MKMITPGHTAYRMPTVDIKEDVGRPRFSVTHSTFKRIVDALFKGADGDTFGDPGPELPEFLGLCNRLSCGDI
ncbi:hypothetical protein OSTOST_23143, partial [Ostertagia ostertagi]